jgi:hypothetical protein
MSQLSLGSSLKRAAAAIAAFGVIGTAHAAVYTGTWDPAYGAPFNQAGLELGWKGSATFTLPDSCVAAGGVVTSFDCLAAPGMQVVNAQVQFYKLSDLSLIETLNFGSGAFVYSMTFDSALSLTAVETSFFTSPLRPVSTFGGLQDYSFHLIFDGSGAQLVHTKVGIYSSPNCLTKTSDVTLCGTSFDSRTATGSTPFTFTTIQAPIPEPQTYALLLAGLAAVGIAARRRQA